VTRRVAIGPILVGAISAACTCGRRPDGDCDDPSLWYEPGGGAGVYWGCTPPEGWTNTPPRGTADTSAPVDPSPDDAPLVVIPEPENVDTGWLGTGFTGTTGGTGATGMTGDTGVFDTGLPLDTALPMETGPIETAAADTAPPDTSAPVADTAAAPAVEPAPPVEEPPP
jgi:hypothetical protein